MTTCLLLASCAPVRHFDFNQAKDKSDAYLRVRLSASPEEESVFYWTGSVFSFVPGEASRWLFRMEGYNISKAEKTEKGFHQLGREVVLFRDTAEGKILEKWFNPFLGDSVEVLHIWNDPANFSLPLTVFERKNAGILFERLPDGKLSMYVDSQIKYPSPLPKKEYPENSRSDTYQAMEVFNFFFEKKDLENKRLNAVPTQFSWIRWTDFLPWMRMSDRPGYIVFSARGSRLEGGFEALPDELKNYVLAHDPIFQSAPDTLFRPNMNSWRYFKKISNN